MAMSNKWLNPLQRSYDAIKSTLIQKLKINVPEVTDYSEGNIFVVIISVFSAIAEGLHYYIDSTAQETFFITARRYSSLYKHAKLVDYHIKSAVPSSVDLTLYRQGNLPIPSDILIPINTQFTSNDGKTWLTSKTINWPKNTYSIKVPVVQKSISSDGYITFGTVEDEDIQISLGQLPTSQKYVEGSITLIIGGHTWNLVETFAYSDSNSRVFKVEPNDILEPIIIFGDGKYGMKPEIGSVVEGQYYLTYGSLGNLPANSFSQIPTALSNIQSDLVVTNLLSTTGGSDYEDFDMIKEHLPLSIKTLGVAITRDDYEALTKLIPGVSKAYVDYKCGKFVDIYITPDNGGVASLALLQEVDDRLSESKVITTTIEVKSTQESQVYLELDIYGKRSFNQIDISNQVKRAIVDTYSPQTSDINKTIRLSDIYALVDNLSMVDYLKLKNIYFIPTPIPYNSQSTALIVTSFIQEYLHNVDKESITVTITSSNTYNINTNIGVVYNGIIGQSLSVTTIYSKFNITIGQSGLPYTTGDVYTFTIQQMNDDLTPIDFHLPIISEGNIKLNIYEQI